MGGGPPDRQSRVLAGATKSKNSDDLKAEALLFAGIRQPPPVPRWTGSAGSQAGHKRPRITPDSPVCEPRSQL